jgi:NAD(P)H-dependent flavin oxidoreductase YrpB (nitropropane dioxygenase family)
MVGANSGEPCVTRFDPQAFSGGQTPSLRRPKFIAIISSATLGTMLVRRATGVVDGFVLEGPTAGGHNAPPRGKLRLSASGEPIYSERDTPDISAIRALGLPFWLAGSCARPDRLGEALAVGASGVQVGTAFAYCDESDLAPELKQRVLNAIGQGSVSVFTDPLASPTGFPFKVVRLDNTFSNDAMCELRTRVCDLGYLRQVCELDDGTLAWRCPAEPVADYVRKGGCEADTQGRKCICNALMANVGFGQLRPNGEMERPLVTSGSEINELSTFFRDGEKRYTAADVIRYLLPDVYDSCHQTNTSCDNAVCSS